MLRHWRNLLSGWECFLCMGCLEKLDHLINMPASVQKNPTEEHTCTVFRSEERDDN